ncbi:MAG: serine/threonine-protein phosphatase [Leptospiraceae bacterium]|nr:serine/threonine-protein phosphatase [Leptospiraceae bacterium]
MSGVAIYRIYIMNWHMRMYSKELEEKNIILKLINEEKDNLNNDLEDLNRNLEIKVVERTQEIFDMMEKIKTLKVQQDADYFLTTLIEKPLCKINNDSKIIHVDTFTRQKKAFEFRNKKWELGGDISIVSNLHFSSFDDKYIFFFNGDAMGKSMQGAGGAIVAGTAIHNILNRAYARKRPVRKKPDVWLNEVYNELDSVFRTFEGSMLMSGVIGLIREKTGEVLLINAEHPLSILYKDNRASFIEDSITLHKMGAPIDTEFKMERFNLNKGDSLIIGSDGKDDLELFQENGKLIMNEKETLILEFVEEGKGDLKEIISVIDKRANIIDDISLLKITMT